MVMKYLTMSGCVTVTGPPASICALNFGTTDPFEASTLPNRTEISRIGDLPTERVARSWSNALQYISAKSIVMPSIDTGTNTIYVTIIIIHLTAIIIDC